MRIARSLCLLAFLLFVTINAVAGDIAGLSSKKLANGLDVIVVENHAVPLVTVEIAVKSGGFVEAADYSGLSHLYEHMFFKANRAIPNQEAYLKRLRELGASWNGTTNTERVNYFLILPTENTREGTIFLRDALLTPLFLQKELERERVVVLGEFDRAEAQPGFLLGREMDRKLWGDQYSRKSVIGDREVIVTTPREKMVTLKERYYVPNNSALLFAGDIKPQEAYALADELFSDWKSAGDPHKLYPEPPIPPIKQSSTIAVIAPVKSARLQISWQGPSMSADPASTFAADVLTTILLAPTSRFYKNLVDSGLFDNVQLVYLSQEHTGPITAAGTTSPDRLDRAHAALLNEISHMADPDYFTDEQLATAKDQLDVSEIYGREQPSNFVHTVSFWWATAGLDYYRNYLDNLRRITRADTQNYVRRYIAGKPSVTGVLVSQDNLGKVALLKNAEVIHPAKGSSGTAMTAQKADVATEEFDVDGVRVVLRKNPNSEVVGVRALIKGGVGYSGAARAGLEKMMLDVSSKQSTNYPKDKMARDLTRLGSTIDDGAGLEYSTFTLTSLQRSFDESMRIFLDALVHPVFTDSEVALVRERRLNELRQNEDNPDAYIGRLAMMNAYGAHPFAADPLGTPDLVKSATVKQLQETHGAVTRGRLLLVVVGNVTRQQLESLLRPVVKDVPATDYHAADLAPMPDADRASTKLVARDLPTVYVEGFFPAPNPRSEDYPAATVAMNILSHRLFEEIRTKRNLSYAPFAGMRRSSLALGQLYVTTPNPNAAIGVMRDEVEKMRTTPVGESELKDAVRQMKTNTLVATQGSNDIATTLGDWEVVGGGWRNFEAYLSKLDDVTPEQVRRAMDRYAHKVDFTLLGKVEGVDTKLLESF